MCGNGYLSVHSPLLVSYRRSNVPHQLALRFGLGILVILYVVYEIMGIPLDTGSFLEPRNLSSAEPIHAAAAATTNPRVHASPTPILTTRESIGTKTGNFQPSRDNKTDGADEVAGPLAVDELEGDDGKGEGEDEYHLYSGDGTTDDGWPDIDDWVSFDDMYVFRALPHPPFPSRLPFSTLDPIDLLEKSKKLTLPTT